jgi:hypothetical protein
MIIREQCCCDDMRKAVSSENEVPISVKKFSNVRGKFLNFLLEFVDTYNAEKLAEYGEIAEDGISFCPFCGKQVDPYEADLSGKWRKRKHMCESFLAWFMEGGEYYPNEKAPTPMFKYDPKENQFYMHHRKGFGEGWIPITYCIYCGEPLSEMVEKHGLSKFIAAKLDPSEWQGKYILCHKEPKVTDYAKISEFLQTRRQLRFDREKFKADD